MTQSEKPTLMQMMKEIHAEALDPTPRQPQVLTGMIDKMMAVIQDNQATLTEVMVNLSDYNNQLYTENEKLKDKADKYDYLIRETIEGYCSAEGSSDQAAYLTITGYDDLYPMTYEQKDAVVTAEMKGELRK